MIHKRIAMIYNFVAGVAGTTMSVIVRPKPFQFTFVNGAVPFANTDPEAVFACGCCLLIFAMLIDTKERQYGFGYEDGYNAAKKDFATEIDFYMKYKGQFSELLSSLAPSASNSNGIKANGLANSMDYSALPQAPEMVCNQLGLGCDWVEKLNASATVIEYGDRVFN